MEADWTNLPEDLLSLVSEILEILSNFLRFRVVCNSWLRYNRRLAKMLARRQHPMLLIASESENTWNVYNIMNNKVLDLQINVPTKRCCGSSKGWLVFVENDFLVNLVDALSRVIGMEEKQNSTIRLPPLSYPKTNLTSCEGFFKAMISADPIEDTKDCVVVITYGLSTFYFIGLGKDITWKTVSVDSWGIEEVLNSGEKYYAVGARNSLISFDTAAQSNSYVNNLMERSAPRVGELIKRYIVDLNEKLMVQRHMIKEPGEFKTLKFKLFESSLDMGEWVEKQSLGDAALFVGNMNTISVPASSISNCQPDCIYFTYDGDYVTGYNVRFSMNHSTYDDFGVYNMKTKSISKHFTRDANTLVENTKLPPVWVVPRFQL